ncbi:MAG: sodium:solute symporter [Bacteroidetes bacterium HGW-Bacteroidetes-4]|jgi:sodium/pantothenate symporter|nr:MAG: sodium:solute symporter [Bacteroidetes bacterium HGW-Bacteroidetes-4]
MATTGQVIGTWILIILYASAIIYFVIKGASSIKNMKDYAVGNVSFSPFFVGLSLAAAMTSAATFVINPGLIATYGWSGVLSFGLFFPLASVISLTVLTKSFRRYGESVSAVSLASWIGKRFNSEKFALFIAFLSVLLITFIVLILVALTKVFASALNTNEVATLAAIILFVFGYMMFGGANSMVYTNMIQSSIMIVVAVILIFSGISHFQEGIGGFFQKLTAIDPNLVSNTNANSPLFRNFYEIAFAQIIIGIAVVCQPHIITKSLLLKKETDVNKFLITAVVVELLFFSVVIAGLYARIEFPDLSVNGERMMTDSIIPNYVVKVFSNGTIATLVGLLVIMGLVSAGLSTLEGLIQSLSSSISNDLIKPLWGEKRKLSDARYIKLNKITIAILAVVAFLMSRDQLLHPKLSVAILAQNGVYAYFSIIFIPILMGIFMKEVKVWIPFTAAIVATLTHFGVYYFLPFLVSKGLHFGAFDIFLQGQVRNPAIAASTAIILSLLVGFGLLGISKLQSKKTEVSI